MRVSSPPEFQSESLLPALSFDRLLPLLQARALALSVPLHDGHGRSVWIENDQGEYGAKKLGTGSLLFARAHRPEWLADARAQIATLARDAGSGAPDWSTDGDSRAPVNFSLARVEWVRPVSASFLRLRLTGADLSRLGQDDSIHFRLVQPPLGAAPHWPVVGARGQTVWPQGDHALRRPVYTTRHIQTGAGEAHDWLETDIFTHPGGRTTDWALSAAPGTVIGLMGPSGGGIPEGDRLILAGDETAYPAIARFLTARANIAQGQVWLLGRSNDYPLPDAPGFDILHRPGGESQLAAQLQKCPLGPRDSLWVGAERRAIEPLRQLAADKIAATALSCHVSAFWTA